MIYRALRATTRWRNQQVVAPALCYSRPTGWDRRFTGGELVGRVVLRRRGAEWLRASAASGVLTGIDLGAVDLYSSSCQA